MKVLWIGDSPLVSTGFGRVTANVLKHLAQSVDVTCLALLAKDGEDFSGFPYQVIPTNNNVNPELVYRVLAPGYDAVIVNQDPWIVREFAGYLHGIKSFPYVAIDGLHIKTEWNLNQFTRPIAYTNFGKQQLIHAGNENDPAVIPHGIDAQDFYPLDKERERKTLGFEDFFIVSSVNRNQPRKRLDLTIRYFAEFADDKPDAMLYYHGCLQDGGWDIEDLCRYYGCYHKLLLTSRKLTPHVGVPVEILNKIYNISDVNVSTSLGEGWGLTTMESMACGVAQIVPDWSALGEWPGDAVTKVACSDTVVNTGNINTVGGVADKKEFILALNHHYYDRDHCRKMGARARERILEPQFSWQNIAAEFLKVVG